MTPEQLSAAIVDALTALPTRARSPCPTACPGRWSWSVRRARSTATTPPTWRSSWPRRPACPRGSWPGCSPSELAAAEGIAGVEIAGPGFLNVRVEAGAQGAVAAQVVAAGAAYGAQRPVRRARRSTSSSSPPTRPARSTSAAPGGPRSATRSRRIFTVSGAEVTREYYFNDHGAQIDRFSRSLLAAAKGEPAPEDGYGGEYIADIAQQVIAKQPDVAGPARRRGAGGVPRGRGGPDVHRDQATLHDFGVDFDVYFHENNLHESGAVERAIERLTELGNTYEKDGALWLRTKKFGDDKDRVIIKSDGRAPTSPATSPTTSTSGSAGFDRCLIMLGADHHGYVGRLKAMCAAFGDSPGTNLEILIGQLVNLLRTASRCGCRSGRAPSITQDDLVDAIGVDAARYALVRYTTDTTIDIDLDLWAKQTSDNPVFYVQYAHARLASILRNAADLGLGPAEGRVRPALLAHEKEGDLLRALAEFPRVVPAAAAAARAAPGRALPRGHRSELQKFWDDCPGAADGRRGGGADPRGPAAALEATRTVLENGLGLLGVSAPERM